MPDAKPLMLIDARKLPTTPLQSESLLSQERALYRAEIGSTVEAMLASWFTPSMSEAAQAAYLMDWTDEMEGFKAEQVRKAFQIYRYDQPDRRPNPGHIRRILNDRWGKHVMAQIRAKQAESQPEPRETVSPDRVAEIMAQFRAPKAEGEA